MNIVNFGSCNIDYVYSLNHIVRAGETLPGSRREVFAGGKGLNQSIAAARAGVKIYHAGCIGEDGGFLLEIMEESGVDTRFMRKVQGPSGHAIIEVDEEGENAIIIHKGANGMFDTACIDEVLEHFGDGDLVILQNEINNNDYIIKKAFERGMRTILNPSPIDEAIQKIDFEKISVILINEHEGEALTGCKEPAKILSSLRQRYAHLDVILTLGEQGCMYACGDKTYLQPAFNVETVDTTAAGDTFTGYFISAFASSLSPKESLRLACAASALSVTKKGAAPSIPYLDTVREALKTLKIKNNKTEELKAAIDAYLDAHLPTATLKDLSRTLGYSVCYTGQLVRAECGKTFTDYLSEKRCAEAAKLLIETDLQVCLIIQKVGYNNANFFRRKFIAAYALTPLNYRKTMRGKAKNEY